MLVYTHSEHFPHLHTCVNSFPPSSPLHNSPSGCCHCKRGTWDMKKTERCESAAWTLQSYLLLKSFVSPRGCVDVFCLWACLCAQIVSHLVYLCVRVHAFWQYLPFARKTSLWRSTARSHSSPKVSEFCFLQTKWWHPVSDSDCPHRFAPNRADSSSPVFLMERSSEI